MSEQSIHGVTCTCCGEVVSSRFIEDGECVGCRNGGDVADPRLVTDGGVPEGYVADDDLADVPDECAHHVTDVSGTLDPQETVLTATCSSCDATLLVRVGWCNADGVEAQVEVRDERELPTDGGVDTAPSAEPGEPDPTAAPPHYDPARVFVEGTAEEVVDVVHHVRGSDWVTLWCELEDGRAVDKRYVPNERVIFIEPGADDE